MNFNTILYRLGIDPTDFENQLIEPIKTDDGFIFEVKQKVTSRICPHCGSIKTHIHDHDIIEINCSDNKYIKDILRIFKVRLKCNDCHKTFTIPVNGIDAYRTISQQTMKLIRSDLCDLLTFRAIAEKYGISTARVIQIFDEIFKFVPRKSLPFALCIDEIKFIDKKNSQKYCCVLYDHNGRDIVDILKNRQLAYLNEYFEEIRPNERDKVKFFISDMYDGYRTIKRKYFPKALHIIDLFHVVKLLGEAIKRIRTDVMNRQDRTSMEYKFMKSHWRLFQCRREDIPDKWYTPKGQDPIHFSDMIYHCQCLDSDLLEASNILYDLYRYKENETFTQAAEFILYIANRLRTSNNQILVSVGDSYLKWHVEIANGLAKNQGGKRYSNGIAEAINNLIKTIVKVSYGYQNFDRFRKRIMLIYTYKKSGILF